eukprot:GILJ01004213.1.p1 GENE.GILJ01004213.1~~GILJ01004213.1.p1  ORF type:complete len:212 (+),score=10.43 GILJ01004213.1:50-685(+)
MAWRRQRVLLACVSVFLCLSVAAEGDKRPSPSPTQPLISSPLSTITASPTVLSNPLAQKSLMYQQYQNAMSGYKTAKIDKLPPGTVLVHRNGSVLHHSDKDNAVSLLDVSWSSNIFKDINLPRWNSGFCFIGIRVGVKCLSSRLLHVPCNEAKQCACKAGCDEAYYWNYGGQIYFWRPGCHTLGLNTCHCLLVDKSVTNKKDCVANYFTNN